MKGTGLTTRIHEAPKTPGVYVWRAPSGTPIYIGKAADLRARLSNYPKTRDTRIRLMVAEAASLDWEATETDIDALILESALIKRHRPRYNVQWMDDKQYFLVAVTDEPFPQFILTHQHRSAKLKKPVRELIGPFTEGVSLKATLRILRTLFPTCSCKQTHHVKCLNAHIGKCPGYCCLKAPATAAQKREYARHVRAVRDILTGKRAGVVARLAKTDPDLALRVLRVFRNAQVNARRQRTAAAHHGALAQLAAVFGLAGEPHRIEGYDIATLHGRHSAGAMAVFTDGRADTAEYRLFNIRGDVVGDVPMLRQVLQRRLSHPEWPMPDLILVDGAKGQLNAAIRALADAGLAIPVLALTKDERHRGDHVYSSLEAVARPLRDLPRQLADLLVHVDAEAHRFSIRHYRTRHRRSVAN